MVRAPWTDEQVSNLNAYQVCGWAHPFTCASGSRTDGAHSAAQAIFGGDFGQLVATREGWICRACDYRQDWAHDHMAEPLGPNPLTAFLTEQGAPK